jgi:hypothetical protein
MLKLTSDKQLRISRLMKHFMPEKKPPEIHNTIPGLEKMVNTTTL